MDKAKCTISTVLLLVLAGCATVDTRWQKAASTDKARAYEAFLKKHPDSDYTVRARENIESLHWQEAMSTDKIQAYNAFLKRHPDSEHAVSARLKVESLHWKEAVARNSLLGFKRYVELNSDGRHVDEAKQRIEEFRWKEATLFDMVHSYEEFLSAYPSSRHSSDAAARLEVLEWEKVKRINTRDVYDALLLKYPSGPLSAKVLAELKTCAKIVPSMTNPITYHPWDNDGWEYDYTVRFAETQGVPANVERVKKVYTDRRGVEWSANSSWSSVRIPIRGRGRNTYNSWVRGDEYPDLKGGAVTVTFSGHDENGHPFSGSVSSKLAWPKEEKQ